MNFSISQLSSLRESCAFWYSMVVLLWMGSSHQLSLLNCIRCEEVADNIVTSSYVGRQLECFKIGEALCLDEIQIFLGVEVLLIRLFIEVQVIVRAIILIIVVLRDSAVNRVFLIQANCCLVGPTSRYILDCVATSSKYEQRYAPGFYELDAGSMPLYRTIVGAKLIVSDRVSATLDHNCIWSEPLSDLFHDLQKVKN